MTFTFTNEMNLRNAFKNFVLSFTSAVYNFKRLILLILALTEFGFRGEFPILIWLSR